MPCGQFPATQVAHYAAELVGVSLILWVCRLVTRRQALLVVVPGVVVLILTHTRTALIGMLLGLAVAGLSLFTINRNIRRAFAVVTLVVIVVVLPLSSLVTSWLSRGESSQQLSSFTGRTSEWAAVLSEQRPETNKILGSGLSNDTVNSTAGAGLAGIPIDSGWISTYQDQGIVGDVIEGMIFLGLILLAFLRPRGPTRSLALFIIVYCFIASFTESGMGNASAYLLDLTIAASLLALPSAAHLFAAERDPRVSIQAPPRAISVDWDSGGHDLVIPPAVRAPIAYPERPLIIVPGSDPHGSLAPGAFQVNEPSDSSTAQVAAAGAWGLAGRAVLLLANLAATPLLIRWLGPAGYGLWALLLTSLTWAALADVGMGSASTKFASEHYAKGDSRGESTVIWSALAITALTTSCVALLLAVEAPLIVGGVLHVTGTSFAPGVLALRIICVLFVVQAVGGTLNTPQLVRLRWRPNTIITTSATLVATIGAPIVVFIVKGGVATVATVWVVGAVIGTLGTVWLAFRLLPALRHPHIDRTTVRRLAGFGGALTVSGLASLVLGTSERAFLAHNHSTTVVAYYAVAATLGTTLYVLPEQLLQPLLPIFSRLDAEGRFDEHCALYRKSLVGMFLILTPGALFLAFLAQPFLSIWAGPAYGVHSIGPLLVMVFGIWLYCFAWVPGSYLLSSGRTKLIAYIEVAEIAPFLLGAWILTAKFGAMGAAVTWSATLVVATFAYFAVVHRVEPRLPVSPLPAHRVRSVAAPLLLACALAAAATVTQGLILRGAVAAALGVVYALVLWRVVLTRHERKGAQALVGDVLHRGGPNGPSQDQGAERAPTERATTAP